MFDKATQLPERQRVAQTTPHKITATSANLDVLRAVAVVCVLISHVARVPGVLWLGSLGRFGVIMFFFHTSLVLMESLDRMSKGRTHSLLIRDFLVRRAFRIYPLAVLTVLVVVTFRVPATGVGSAAPFSIGQILSNLALTQNLTYSSSVIAPLWSLPLEVQMYVLLPFLFLLLRRWSVHPLLCWVASVAAALTLPRVSSRFDVFTYAPCFVSGVVAYQWSSRRSVRLPTWCWPTVLVLAGVIFGPLDNVSLGVKVHRAWAVSLLLAFGYLITDELKPSYLSKLAHKIATFSYGIYLSHVILIYAAVSLFHHQWSQMMAFALALLFVPQLLFNFLERPAIALGRLLSSPPEHFARSTTFAVADPQP